jgi:hypothetical protein
MKKILIVALLAFVPISAWAQVPGVQPERIVTLIFNSNVYGEIEPCG